MKERKGRPEGLLSGLFNLSETESQSSAELARRRVHLLDEPGETEVQIVDLVFRAGEVLHPQRSLPTLVRGRERNRSVSDDVGTLERDLRSAITAMDHISQVLGQVRRDCT